MNRSLVAIAVVLMTMLTPTNALAWFGWLDSLTGPGPFWGLMFDLRAICFGDRLPDDVRRLTLAAIQADLAAGTANLAARDSDPTVAKAWADAAEAWRKVFGNAPEDPKEEAARTRVNRQFVLDQQEQVRLLGAVGVFFNACSPDVIRRSSIDFAIDLWWAGREQRFAGGESVNLVTAKVSYSFALFPRRTYDVLDLSMGAGMFWLTSRGFVAPITGPILVPARIYLHAPSRWQKETGLKKFLTYPVFSAAAVVFPKGFPDNIFLSPGQIASGVTQDGHPAEIQPSFAVFVNVFPK
jgi:hypothetical protein